MQAEKKPPSGPDYLGKILLILFLVALVVFALSDLL